MERVLGVGGIFFKVSASTRSALPALRRTLPCLTALAAAVHCGSSTTQGPGTDASVSPEGGEGGASGGSPGSGGKASTGGTPGTGGTSKGSGGTGTGGTGAGGSPGTGGKQSFEPCEGMRIEQSVQDGGRDTDRFTWRDALCQPRSASLVRALNGYLRKFVYVVDGAPRTCIGTDAGGQWQGFGYAISHHPTGVAMSTLATRGTFGTVFSGKHHAIHQYAFDLPFGGGVSVPTTVHWMFATGRDHVVYAITYDSSALPRGAPGGDSRSPYGDMFWEGETGTPTTIAGVGWGDRRKFVTTREPLTSNSTWEYTAPNTVPYALEWATAPDAEMGLVQTESYLRHDSGGYWHYRNWGKTSANQTRENGQAGEMPVSWNWTYQLNQYELCNDTAGCVNNTTSSHRLAWGMNYGAVGGATDGTPAGTYSVYGDDRRASGHPFQSYSVFVVFGQHSRAAVSRQVEAVEAVSRVALTATRGTVNAQVPGGVGRTDTVASEPPGYDARYATWSAAMAGGDLDLTVNVSPGGAVPVPVLVVSGYEKATPPTVTIDGRTATADAEIYASVDTERKLAWLTFPGGWAGQHAVTVR